MLDKKLEEFKVQILKDYNSVLYGNSTKTYKGGTRKIADLNSHKFCRDPQHEPANMMCYRDGVYEHICPSCGSRQVFVVENPTMEIV